MIEDHYIRMVLFDRLPDLGQFSGTDEETWIGFFLVTGNYAEGREARGSDQLDKFVPVFAECRRTELDMDQYGSLPAGRGFNQRPSPKSG
mgnify:CR=1 FL=1